MTLHKKPIKERGPNQMKSLIQRSWYYYLGIIFLMDLRFNSGSQTLFNGLKNDLKLGFKIGNIKYYFDPDP